jgi:hypothetical protein
MRYQAIHAHEVDEIPATLIALKRNESEWVGHYSTKRVSSGWDSAAET